MSGGGSLSKRCISTAMPPTPSTSAWCNLITSAAPSPSTPSTTTASQGGSSASNPMVAIAWAKSSTSLKVELGRQEHAPKMEVEIEAVVRHELRPPTAQRSGSGPRPEPRDDVNQRCHPISDVCPTRGPVQCHHGDDRRPQHRISADGPQQGVGTTHRVHDTYSFIDHWQLPHLIVRPGAEESQCRKSHPLPMRIDSARGSAAVGPGDRSNKAMNEGRKSLVAAHAEVAWWSHVDRRQGFDRSSLP